MKKTIIFNRKYADTNREQVSAQEYNLVFPQNVSIVDLPYQIGQVLINKDRITFKVISWCMFPVIWAGDTIKVEPLKPEDATIGDIILYKSAGRAYAHRLINKYEKQGELYIVTSGEQEYRSRRLSGIGGVPAGNILGKVIEIKRGKLSFRPGEAKLSLASLIQGRLKLWLWTLFYKARQYIAEVFIRLQKFKIYRWFFKRFIGNKILFFVGTPIIKNRREINNFCFYRRFDDFSEKCEVDQEIYNLSARIYNRPIGNISLLFDTENPSCKTCALSNFIVRIPFRGGGVGYRLLEKALYLCNKVNIDEIKVILSEEDKAAYNLFKKSEFRIWI